MKKTRGRERKEQKDGGQTQKTASEGENGDRGDPYGTQTGGKYSFGQMGQRPDLGEHNKTLG